MQAHVIPVGNLANQMLQLVFLENLRRRLPALQITGVQLPLWGIERPPATLTPPPKLRLYGQFVDRERLIDLLEDGRLTDFEFAALGFRMENLLPREDVARLFPPLAQPAASTGPDELLLNVRGAEILQDVHEDYGPLPVAYLRQLVDATGLKPVLMGQLGDDWYSDALREAFPGCRQMPSQGALVDFDVIRNAHHIAMSLSSFSWLASWLSRAQSIHMPVVGILNPDQRPEINLLPVDDPRYRFYSFDVRHWKASPDQIQALSQPGYWPELGAQALRERLSRAQQDWLARKRRYRRKMAWALWRTRLGLASRVGLS